MDTLHGHLNGHFPNMEAKQYTKIWDQTISKIGMTNKINKTIQEMHASINST